MSIGGLPLLVVALFFVDRVRLSGKVGRGVELAGVDVSGAQFPEVQRVAAELERRLSEAPLSMRIRGHERGVAPAELGFRLDEDGTARAALAKGRGQGLLHEFRFWLGGFSRKRPAEVVVAFDQGKALEIVDALQRDHADLPFSGGVKVISGGVALDPARAGHVVHRERALSELARVLASVDARAFELPLVEQEPLRVPAELDAALVRARRLTEEAITLREGGSTLRFERADLLRALRSRPPSVEDPHVALTLDPTVVDEKLEELRKSLEAPPVNARFAVDDKDHVSVEPGRAGTLLESSKVAAALLDAAEHPEREGKLPITRGAEPEVTAPALEGLEITKLVGRFTTHHPCCQPRVDNIHRIADLLRGQVVKPGDTFSVNALIGPRTAKNGFKPAPTIEEGEMVDSLGGGVSQFATTLFNALFLAGYDILERSPHTYWFARYPMGRDATLSWPKPDVAFKNDTDGGALIWPEYGDDFITVKVFGKDSGRKVKIRVTPQQDVVQPPIEYIPDMTQTHEKDKVKEAGQAGWTVFVFRQIDYPDKTKKEEKRKVVYKPRTRRVIVHPCRVPQGEPGYTGEKCPEPDGGDGKEE